MAAVLFTNVRMFDGAGAPPFWGEVLIRGERTVNVACGNHGLDPAKAEVVEGGGPTLMPGLVEGHAHLTWPSSVERAINMMELPPEEHLLVTAQNARITLDHGFTSANLIQSAGTLGIFNFSPNCSASRRSKRWSRPRQPAAC